MALKEEEVRDLKAKHGDDLIGLETRDGVTLVFRRPNRQEYNRWFDRRDEHPSTAGLELAQSCVVHPGVTELVTSLDRFPALLMCVGGIIPSLADLAGADRGSEKAKKL